MSENYDNRLETILNDVELMYDKLTRIENELEESRQIIDQLQKRQNETTLSMLKALTNIIEEMIEKKPFL